MQQQHPAGLPAVFTFSQTNPIRVVDVDGEPWFVGRDVAEALGYTNATDAMKRHCRGVAKRYPIVDDLGRPQQARILAEPDVMRLIVHSKLPAAEKFERWVFEEVLPAIRKHGLYAVPRASSPAPTAAGAERLTAQDMANLRRAIWRCSVGQHYDREGWTRALWTAIRRATGTQGPFLVEHLPLIGDTLREACRVSDAIRAACEHLSDAGIRAVVSGVPAERMKMPPLKIAADPLQLDWWTDREIGRLVSRGEPIMDHPECMEP